MRDRLTYGPLVDLPRCSRLKISRAVMAGQRVDGPLAEMGVRFAQRQARIYGILLSFSLVVVLVTLLDAGLGGVSVDNVAVLLGWLVLGGLFGKSWRRARQSLDATLAPAD